MKVQVSFYGAWTNSSVLKINSDETWKKVTTFARLSFLGLEGEQIHMGIRSLNACSQSTVLLSSDCRTCLKSWFYPIWIQWSDTGARTQSSDQFGTLHRLQVCCRCFGQTETLAVAPIPRDLGWAGQRQPRAPTWFLHRSGEQHQGKAHLQNQGIPLSLPLSFFIRKINLGSEKTNHCWCAVPDNEETQPWG